MIALINNQIEAFSAKGLKAVHYYAHLDESTRSQTAADTFQLSPETLLRDREFRDYLECDYYQIHLAGLVVDEAHVVKKW